MALTNEALEKINQPTIRMKIALALGVTEQSVIKAIKVNSDVLTKFAAMKVIKKETGLTESQIIAVAVTA